MGVEQWKEKIQSWKTQWDASKKKNYVVVGAIAIVGIWGIATIITMRNPVYRTLKGISKLANKNKYEVTVGIETKTNDRLI